MTRFLGILSFLVLLCACNEQDSLFRWYERGLTYEEKASYKPEFWKQNVEKSLEVRDRMGWDIPDDIFRHFVLPVQVQDRPLDNFRLAYADTLCRRVAGMSMWDAAREINYWCYEHASYKGKDYSYDSAMGTLERGVGACDELANLYISALRAAGIPARAASVRWMHATTSHTWAEIWIDGEWHFECPVEPWENLDKNWLCAGASKGIIVSVKVFGRYRGPEPVLSRDKYCTVIDNGARYRPKRTTTVTVVDARGRSVRGANVEFKIFNLGNLVTLYSSKTDRKGRASLETAETGSLAVWASKDGMFGLCRADKAENGLAMVHSLAKGGSAEFLLNSPDRVSLPFEPTAEEIALSKTRGDAASALRESRLAVPRSDSLITACKAEVLRPHLPASNWTMPGKTSLEIYGDDKLEPGSNYGILRILENGCTEPVWSTSLDPGTYMVSCASRTIANSALVKATVFTIPEGAKTLALQISLPEVPPAKLKYLYQIKDRSTFGPCDASCQVVGLTGEDPCSKAIKEWVIDINKKLPTCKLFHPGSEEYKSAQETMAEVGAALGLEVPFIIMNSPDGKVWYATDKWTSDTEYELTSVRNAIEKL